MLLKEKNVYFLTAIVLLVASYFSTGYHHFDEHFQLLEFAGLKLGLTTSKNLPWEYHAQMRSSFQPILAIGIYRFLGWFHLTNPFHFAFVLRLLSAALTFTGIALLYKVYSPQISSKVLRKWFILFSFFLWYNIYNGVRYSSENWSGILFIIAFSIYSLIENKRPLHYLSIGLVLGISFLCRYQAGFLVAGWLSWIIFIKKEKFSPIALVITGISIVVLMGFLMDRWFYGEWTCTALNYLDQNILQNKVSSFGIDPWWWYFKKFFIQGIPPFSLLFIIAIGILIVFHRKSAITWSILPFLVVHFIVGHKELRFLFPIVCFLPIILIKAMETVEQKHVSNLVSNKWTSLFMKSFILVNFMFLLIVSFRPADNQISLYKKIYADYKTPTTLYYLENNPYHRVLNIHFYKRKNLRIKRVESYSDIQALPNAKTLVVFTNKDNPPNYKDQNKLVYTSFPAWVKTLNFNGWLDRTKAWYVYEINTTI